MISWKHHPSSPCSSFRRRRRRTIGTENPSPPLLSFSSPGFLAKIFLFLPRPRPPPPQHPQHLLIPSGFSVPPFLPFLGPFTARLLYVIAICERGERGRGRVLKGISDAITVRLCYRVALARKQLRHFSCQPKCCAVPALPEWYLQSASRDADPLSRSPPPPPFHLAQHPY